MSIETIKECIMNDYTLTNIEKLVFIDYSISTHSGKMEKIPSISTSSLENTYCNARCKNNESICSKCYARRLLKMRKSLREKMTVNHKFYTTYDVPAIAVPHVNASIFRFESFGDIENELQVKNYYTIARNNKHCMFVLWTKNPQVIQAAKDKYKLRKPGNLRIIYSENLINAPITDYSKKYSFIDKSFFVFTRDYAKKHGIKINCGAKDCSNCRTCYEKNNIKIICELLK